MEIALIRHGKSLFNENNRITCKEFKLWIEHYNETGVYKENSYPKETVKAISTDKIVIFTSDLKRSIESARYLNPAIQSISDPLFRETELPELPTNFVGIRVKANTWAILLRCLWLIGYSRNCESFNEAKIRAKKATNCLVEFAKVNDVVVLVGHGFMNRLIMKELKKWVGQAKLKEVLNTGIVVLFRLINEQHDHHFSDYNLSSFKQEQEWF